MRDSSLRCKVLRGPTEHTQHHPAPNKSCLGLPWALKGLFGWVSRGSYQAKGLEAQFLVDVLSKQDLSSSCLRRDSRHSPIPHARYGQS